MSGSFACGLHHMLFIMHSIHHLTCCLIVPLLPTLWSTCTCFLAHLSFVVLQARLDSWVVAHFRWSDYPLLASFCWGKENIQGMVVLWKSSVSCGVVLGYKRNKQNYNSTWCTCVVPTRRCCHLFSAHDDQRATKSKGGLQKQSWACKEGSSRPLDLP